MKLTIRQTQALDYLEDQETNEVLLGGGAGSGKSALGCYWLLKNALKYPGTRWLMGRSVAKTLRETTLNTFFQIARMQRIQIETHFRYVFPSSILFYNKSEIMLKDLASYPGDPEFDELGSLELTGAFIDEANQVSHKAKSIVRSRVRFLLDEYSLRPKCLYTCNPAHNWVKHEFRDPFVNGTLDRDKKYVQALLADNPHITKHYKANLEGLEKKDRDRLLYGNWDYADDPSQLMNSESIAALFTNAHVKPEGNKYMSCDVARFGKDKTIIRIWHGYVCILRHEMTKASTVAVADKIKELAGRHQVPRQHIIIDEDGIGGGVLDQIPGVKGFIANASPVNVKPTEKYDSIKTQCAYKLAEFVNDFKFYEDCETVDIRELLAEELAEVKEKNLDKDGKRGLVGKDIMKQGLGRSPDDLDTYIMRMWFEVKRSSGRSATW